MALTPKNASDTLIGVLSDIAAGLNPETILSNKPVIDLRRRYDIDVEFIQWAPLNERYRAIDMNSFDGSDGLGSCQGYGATEQEARLNLLTAIAECDQMDPKPVQRTKDIDCGQFEPNDYVSVGSASDWEQDDE